MTLKDRIQQPTSGTTETKPVPAASPPSGGSTPSGMKTQDYARLRRWLADKMEATLGESQDASSAARMREVFDKLYSKAGVNLNVLETDVLFAEIKAEISGFGPIQQLLDDPGISEIMVNGPKQVYIERKGKLSLSDVTFDDDAHVLRIIERIVRPLGRHISMKSPMVDARLPDGSRVNAIVPPVAIDGPSITIRKFGQGMTMEDLIRFGTLTPTIAEFLEACVCSRLNIVVSGGTGSGKTTLLNVLSNYIPKDERIVTIEDSAELQLGQPHVVRLEARPADADGTGAVHIRDLVKNSLRMRPERIIIGEVRGGEAIDMLQAMNTGHDGSLATIHANNPRETISRMETLAMMSGLDLPVRVIREQIAHAVDLIVQQMRMTDGSRKITHISEVGGMEGETVVMSDIFTYQEQYGEIRPTGIRPFFSKRLESYGFKLPGEMFGASVADMLAPERRRRR